MAGVALALEPGVQRRVLAQRVDRRPRHERQRGHAEPRPRRLDPAHVDLDPRRAGRGGLERALHVLADLPAHPRQLAAGADRGGPPRRSGAGVRARAGTGSRCAAAASSPARRLDEREHVLLADAAAAPGARRPARGRSRARRRSAGRPGSSARCRPLTVAPAPAAAARCAVGQSRPGARCVVGRPRARRRVAPSRRGPSAATAAAAPSPTAIRASTVPTSTVSRPARGSRRRRRSPARAPRCRSCRSRSRRSSRRPRSGRRRSTRQATTVPSATETPIWGIVTSTRRGLSTRGAHGTPPSRARRRAAPPARAAARTGSGRRASRPARPGRRATRTRCSAISAATWAPAAQVELASSTITTFEQRATESRIASSSSGTSERRSSTSTDAPSRSVGRLERHVHHRAVGDHDEVRARARDPRA